MTREKVLRIIHETIYQYFDVCGDNEETPISDKDKLLLEINKSICNNIKENWRMVQPESSTDIQDVLGYLDDVLHPLISPDNWNVYSELHDMVSALPSAQPEVKPPKWVAEDRYVKNHFKVFPHCPQCNAEVKPEQCYCMMCGQHIDWSEKDNDKP